MLEKPVATFTVKLAIELSTVLKRAFTVLAKLVSIPSINCRESIVDVACQGSQRGVNIAETSVHVSLKGSQRSINRSESIFDIAFKCGDLSDHIACLSRQRLCILKRGLDFSTVD